MAKKKEPRRPGRGSQQFVLRLPDGMRDKLHEFARVNGRSANAEIVGRLEKSMVDSSDLETLKAEVAALRNSNNLFQAAMADLENLQTNFADVRALVETMKRDGDAMVEKMKQDYPGRYEAILMELKGDPEPER
jgi:hypothetical protein